MRVVLNSTYELGRQPFGLASPAAWLRAAGAGVTCVDLSRETLPEDAVRAADLVAFYVPMHTATRLAVAALPAVRGLNPGAHLCFYGLYAPVNEAYLRGLGVETILGGEFEAGLAQLYTRLAEQGSASGAYTTAAAVTLDNVAKPAGNAVNAQDNANSCNELQNVISLERLNFLVPDRSGLPPLKQYARV